MGDVLSVRRKGVPRRVAVFLGNTENVLTIEGELAIVVKLLVGFVSFLDPKAIDFINLNLCKKNVKRRMRKEECKKNEKKNEKKECKKEEYETNRRVIDEFARFQVQ